MIPTTLSNNDIFFFLTDFKQEVSKRFNTIESELKKQGNDINELKEDNKTIKISFNNLEKNNEVIKADISKLKKNNEFIMVEINKLKDGINQNTSEIHKLRKDMSQNTSEIHKLRNDMRENIKDMASEITHIYNSIETIKTEMRLQRGMLNLIPQIYEIVSELKEKSVSNEQDHAYYYQKIGEHDTRLKKLENTQ